MEEEPGHAGKLKSLRLEDLSPVLPKAGVCQLRLPIVLAKLQGGHHEPGVRDCAQTNDGGILRLRKRPQITADPAGRTSEAVVRVQRADKENDPIVS